MANPTEYKTVQSRILAYAQEIGWMYVPREEAERRRGFDADGATPEDRARLASLYFDDLLHAQFLQFNPKFKESKGPGLDILTILQNEAKRPPTVFRYT